MTVITERALLQIFCGNPLFDPEFHWLGHASEGKLAYSQRSHSDNRGAGGLPHQGSRMWSDTTIGPSAQRTAAYERLRWSV